MSDTYTDETHRCLRKECKSENVDVSPARDGSVHISCNDCNWLHRFVDTDTE